MTDTTSFSSEPAVAPADPTSGTTISIGDVRRPQMPIQTEVAARSAAGERLEKSLLIIVAALVASPALFVPLLWLIVCSVAAFVVAASAPARESRKRGSADLLLVPLQTAKGALRSVGRVLIPTTFIALLARFFITVLAAVLIAALLTGLRWLLTEGSEGLRAAARIGVLANAPRVFATAVCLQLVLGRSARAARTEAIQKRMRRISEPALSAFAIGIGLWMLIAGLVLPVHGWAPFASGESLFDLLPESAESARVDLARYEAEEVSDCISRSGSAGFSVRAGLTDDGTVAVTLVPDGRMPRSRLEITAAALHNQLAPWVSKIVIGPNRRIVVDRHTLNTDRPIDSPTDLEPGAAGRTRFSEPTESARGEILRCSAVAA